MTKERPILFSKPMVRAILEGRKTQTRRIVGYVNSTVLGRTKKSLWNHLRWDEPFGCKTWVDGPPDPIGGGDGYQYLHVPAANPLDDEPESAYEIAYYRVRPRIEPGDRLWVRETFATGPNNHGWGPIVYSASHCGMKPVCEGFTKWKPSIHMHRHESRITLEVTDVRVQQVQDISLADINAEGISASGTQFIDESNARGHFVDLWDRINFKRGFGWDMNPWVWAITFKLSN